MTFITLVEYNDPTPDPRVTVGIQLKKECPRDVIEMPVKYRQYQYTSTGAKVKATWEEGQTIDGISRVVKHTNKQPYSEDVHNYTIMRRYKYADGTSMGPRFLTIPMSVAEALAFDYKDHIRVRVVKTKTRESFHIAKDITLPERPDVEEARRADIGNPLVPDESPQRRDDPPAKAGPNIEPKKAGFIQKDGKTVMDDKQDMKEATSLADAVAIANSDGAGDSPDDPENTEDGASGNEPAKSLAEEIAEGEGAQD